VRSQRFSAATRLALRLRPFERVQFFQLKTHLRRKMIYFPPPLCCGVSLDFPCPPFPADRPFAQGSRRTMCPASVPLYVELPTRSYRVATPENGPSVRIPPIERALWRSFSAASPCVPPTVLGLPLVAATPTFPYGLLQPHQTRTTPFPPCGFLCPTTVTSFRRRLPMPTLRAPSPPQTQPMFVFATIMSRLTRAVTLSPEVQVVASCFAAGNCL